jgi:orotate phosphoribosyltransferase
MPIGNERGEQIFREAGALIEGHFRLNSGRDGMKYVAKGKITEPGNEAYFEEICQGKVADLLSYNFETLVGPREGAVPYTVRIAEILTEKTGRKIEAVFAAKCTDGTNNFFIRDEDKKHVSGKRCALIEDVATSGGSGKRVVLATVGVGGLVVVASLIWNRGRVTAADMLVPALISQIDVPIDDYQPDPDGNGECPGCAQKLHYHGELGHGKNLPADHPLLPLPAAA